MEKEQENIKDKQVKEDNKEKENVPGLGINVTETISTGDKLK